MKNVELILNKKTRDKLDGEIFTIEVMGNEVTSISITREEYEKKKHLLTETEKIVIEHQAGI